jgi:hypothetical protein
MEQEIKGNDGEVKTVSGSWELGDGRVKIKPCLAFSQSPGTKPAGLCGYGVEVTLTGDVELWIDGDHGLVYERIRSK